MEEANMLQGVDLQSEDRKHNNIPLHQHGEQNEMEKNRHEVIANDIRKDLSSDTSADIVGPKNEADRNIFSLFCGNLNESESEADGRSESDVKSVSDVVSCKTDAINTGHHSCQPSQVMKNKPETEKNTVENSDTNKDGCILHKCRPPSLQNLCEKSDSKMNKYKQAVKALATIFQKESFSPSLKEQKSKCNQTAEKYHEDASKAIVNEEKHMVDKADSFCFKSEGADMNKSSDTCLNSRKEQETLTQSRNDMESSRDDFDVLEEISVETETVLETEASDEKEVGSINYRQPSESECCDPKACDTVEKNEHKPLPIDIFSTVDEDEEISNRKTADQNHSDIGGDSPVHHDLSCRMSHPSNVKSDMDGTSEMVAAEEHYQNCIIDYEKRKPHKNCEDGDDLSVEISHEKEHVTCETENEKPQILTEISEAIEIVMCHNSASFRTDIEKTQISTEISEAIKNIISPAVFVTNSHYTNESEPLTPRMLPEKPQLLSEISEAVEIVMSQNAAALRADIDNTQILSEISDAVENVISSSTFCRNIYYENKEGPTNCEKIHTDSVDNTLVVKKDRTVSEISDISTDEKPNGILSSDNIRNSKKSNISEMNKDDTSIRKESENEISPCLRSGSEAASFSSSCDVHKYDSVSPAKSSNQIVHFIKGDVCENENSTKDQNSLSNSSDNNNFPQCDSDNNLELSKLAASNDKIGNFSKDRDVSDDASKENPPVLSNKLNAHSNSSAVVNNSPSPSNIGLQELKQLFQFITSASNIKNDKEESEIDDSDCNKLDNESNIETFSRCHVCDQQFVDDSSLKSHLKSHDFQPNITDTPEDVSNRVDDSQIQIEGENSETKSLPSNCVPFLYLMQKWLSQELDIEEEVESVYSIDDRADIIRDVYKNCSYEQKARLVSELSAIPTQLLTLSFDPSHSVSGILPNLDCEMGCCQEEDLRLKTFIDYALYPSLLVEHLEIQRNHHIHSHFLPPLTPHDHSSKESNELLHEVEDESDLVVKTDIEMEESNQLHTTEHSVGENTNTLQEVHVKYSENNESESDDELDNICLAELCKRKEILEHRKRKISENHDKNEQNSKRIKKKKIEKKSEIKEKRLKNLKGKKKKKNCTIKIKIVKTNKKKHMESSREGTTEIIAKVIKNRSNEKTKKKQKLNKIKLDNGEMNEKIKRKRALKKLKSRGTGISKKMQKELENKEILPARVKSIEQTSVGVTDISNEKCMDEHTPEVNEDLEKCESNVSIEGQDSAENVNSVKDIQSENEQKEPSNKTDSDKLKAPSNKTDSDKLEVNHTKDHEQNRDFKNCEKCGMTFFKAEHYHKHITKMHTVPVVHKCSKCGIECLGPKSLEAHENTHNFEMRFKNTSRHKCYRCNIGFPTRALKDQHLLIHKVK